MGTEMGILSLSPVVAVPEEIRVRFAAQLVRDVHTAAARREGEGAAARHLRIDKVKMKRG